MEKKESPIFLEALLNSQKIEDHRNAYFYYYLEVVQNIEKIVVLLISKLNRGIHEKMATLDFDIKTHRSFSRYKEDNTLGQLNDVLKMFIGKKHLLVKKIENFSHRRNEFLHRNKKVTNSKNVVERYNFTKAETQSISKEIKKGYLLFDEIAAYMDKLEF